MPKGGHATPSLPTENKIEINTSKAWFHIVVSVVSVVSVVRKKIIGPIEFIHSSRKTSCICVFCCIEQLYGRFP